MQSIELKAARYELKAQRDAAGVPHLEAQNWLEALYGLGYLHALDRPTQMYFARVVASGQASERIANKPELHEMDLFLRRAGIGRHLADEAAKLPPDILEQLDYYSQGVNDGMLAAGQTLPMWVTGFQPRPWDAEAVLLIGNLLSFAGLAVGQQESERTLLELVQLGVGDEQLRELFAPYLDGIDLEPLRDIKFAKRLSDDALELLADLPRLAGSNAWAVSPQRSGTGSAMLASDPHLEVNRLPAIWYEAVLNWETKADDDSDSDSRYAMGATLPGCPLMAVGRTPELAWGVTYMVADTSDLFIEDCRPGGETGWQYRRDEDWHDFDLRVESVAQKNSGVTEVAVYENEQGVLNCLPEEPGKYLSTSWVGNRPGSGHSISSWLSVFHASDASEAMDSVRASPHPSLVWVFADSSGHVGKQASGWLPKRGPGKAGLAPLPAWDPANHWQGVLPPEAMPREYDPPVGFVSSANEELYLSDGTPLHAYRLPDYRKRRIDQRLTELPQATIESMQDLQYDVMSLHADDLLPMLLSHLNEGPLKEQLSRWDRRYTPDSTEATLFQHFYRHVLLEIFGHERGIGWRRMFYLCTRMGFSNLLLTAIDHTLRKVTSSWWRNRDKGEMIRLAAQRALEEPVAPWSQTNQFHFVNRFLGKGMTGRLLGFRSARTPMPGCHATPFQGHLLVTATRESTFAPSYHMVTDLGTDLAWTNLPGGPSESRFSTWYASDIPRWTAGEYKQLTPYLTQKPSSDKGPSSDAG